jgi:hypothetical protein
VNASKRGQARVIEGAIALAVVFLVHVVLQVYVPSFLMVNPELHSVAVQALVGLDASSKLSQLIQYGVSSDDWAPLVTALKASLPSTVEFKLTILDASNGQMLPGMPVSSGALKGTTATVVSYLVQIYTPSTQTVTPYVLTLTVST